MKPGNYDLDLYRGDSYAWKFHAWKDAAKTDPLDLTGATVKAEFRDRPSGIILMTMNTTITTPNIIDMSVDADMWSESGGGGTWDLELTFPDGEVHTLLVGKVIVTADVTNSDFNVVVADA